MRDKFYPIELLDTARALHGTESLAEFPSARRIAEIVHKWYDQIMLGIQNEAIYHDAATFVAAPSSSIAPPEVADQWVGVTMPVSDSSRSPVSLMLPSSTAIFFLWLSLLTDIASGSKSPEELRTKDDALGFWLEWNKKWVSDFSLPFVFSPRDMSATMEEFATFQLIAA